MNKKVISLMLISSLSLASIFQSNLAEAQGKKNVYQCVTRNGKPTTIVETKRGKIELIVWESKFFGTSGWSPERRCQAVTQRFQQFSDNGTLRLITSGRMNNQPVICVAENKAGQGVTCKGDGLLMTLQPKDNPQQVMKDLFNISARVSGGGITRGQGDSTIINMSNFLEEAPLIENGTGDDFTIPEEKKNLEPSPETTIPLKPTEPVSCPPELCG